VFGVAATATGALLGYALLPRGEREATA